jgi:hypothetical protein
MSARPGLSFFQLPLVTHRPSSWLGPHDGHTTMTEKSGEKVDAKTLKKARHPNWGGKRA